MTASKRERVKASNLVEPGSHVRDAILKIHPVQKDGSEVKQVNVEKIEKEVVKQIMAQFTESMEQALIDGKAVDFGGFKVEVYDSEAVKRPAGKKVRLVLRKRFKETLNQ